MSIKQDIKDYLENETPLKVDDVDTYTLRVKFKNTIYAHINTRKRSIAFSEHIEMPWEHGMFLLNAIWVNRVFD